MKIELTASELKELRRIQKEEQFHRRRFVKATVLVMLYEGFAVEEICKALYVDDNTVYRYVRAFESHGLEKYLADNYVKYEGKLTKEQTQLLIAHLEQHLYPNTWAICTYVRDTFGVVFSETGMRDWLNRHGFRYKQAKRIPGKTDEQQQCAFLEETLPPLLEEVQQGQAEVYFMDGTHPTHNTGGVRGWIRCGKDFPIESNSGRKRVNINAAVRASNPEEIVYDVAESVNAQSTLRLCQKLKEKHPDKKVYLICDNARYYRCKLLKDWIQDKDMEFVFLPPYSPNLNIIERLWWFLKKEVLGSNYYDTYSKFRDSIVEFLEHTEEYKTKLRSLLTLNFRTVGGTSIYLSQTTS